MAAMILVIMSAPSNICSAQAGQFVAVASHLISLDSSGGSTCSNAIQSASWKSCNPSRNPIARHTDGSASNIHRIGAIGREGQIADFGTCGKDAIPNQHGNMLCCVVIDGPGGTYSEASRFGGYTTQSGVALTGLGAKPVTNVIATKRMAFAETHFGQAISAWAEIQGSDLTDVWTRLGVDPKLEVASPPTA